MNHNIDPWNSCAVSSLLRPATKATPPRPMQHYRSCIGNDEEAQMVDPPLASGTCSCTGGVPTAAPSACLRGATRCHVACESIVPGRHVPSKCPVTATVHLKPWARAGRTCRNGYCATAMYPDVTKAWCTYRVRGYTVQCGVGGPPDTPHRSTSA